jgi:triosephosphate isomerase
MRVPVIAGNWKMYKTTEEAASFVKAFLPLVADAKGVEIILAAPFTAIATVAQLARGSNVFVSSQNIHFAQEGAFTGEISPRMLKDAGASHCIIGHSERRQYYAETDDSVNQKIKTALAAGLTPIFCLGETLSQREAGDTFNVVKSQLFGGLKDIDAASGPKIIIAYEPVWAIGTGKTATPEQAQEVHAFLRARLKQLWEQTFDCVRILYGGSVKPDNITALMTKEDIDGALVGGASLDADSFAKLLDFK